MEKRRKVRALVSVIITSLFFIPACVGIIKEDNKNDEIIRNAKPIVYCHDLSVEDVDPGELDQFGNIDNIKAGCQADDINGYPSDEPANEGNDKLGPNPGEGYHLQRNPDGSGYHYQKNPNSSKSDNYGYELGK